MELKLSSCNQRGYSKYVGGRERGPRELYTMTYQQRSHGSIIYRPEIDRIKATGLQRHARFWYQMMGQKRQESAVSARECSYLLFL